MMLMETKKRNLGGRPKRDVEIRPFNAKMDLELMKKFKGFASRTPFTMRHHFEKALRSYLEKSEINLDINTRKLMNKGETKPPFPIPEVEPESLL